MNHFESLSLTARDSSLNYRYPSKCLPSAPSGVTASNVDGQLLQRTVSWTAATSPDLGVTGYKAYCKVNGGTNSTATVDADATSAIVGSGSAPNQELEQGKSYVCGVYAYNDAGDGPPGEDSTSFKTDVLISQLGNGESQTDMYPNWDLEAWYSGDTKIGANYLTGLYYTMPVYFGDFIPSEFWTTANDDLISSEFISFTDTSSPEAPDGYVYLANDPDTSTSDKADFINWFGNDTDSVIPLSTLYQDVDVTFRAAVTPVNTVL